MRAGLAPLFMLMKQKPPQLPVWEYSDRILGAFNDKDASKDFGALSGLDTALGKNLGLKGGHFEVQIVDEDAKINVNMGASNEIAHIRLAKELMGNMLPIQYDPLFQQRDAIGQLQRPPHHLLGDHRLGRRRRAALLVRPHERAVVERRRGRLLPALAEALSSQERARTTRSRSCTWCAASPTTSGRPSSIPIRRTRRSAS